MTQIPDAAVQAFMAEFHQRTGVSYEANIRASLEKTLPHLKPVDVAAVRRQAFEEAEQGVNSDIIKELKDAIAWRKLPWEGRHKATLEILERALSAIIAFSVDTSPKNSLNLSNLLRHAFISGFEAKGGTITEAINHWPDYNPEQCQAYERVVSALSAEPAQGKQWQPIETAPKDGSPLILLRNKHEFAQAERAIIAHWSDKYDSFVWADFFDIYADDIDEVDENGKYIFDIFKSNDFTHWMPLPEAPTSEER